MEFLKDVDWLLLGAGVSVAGLVISVFFIAVSQLSAVNHQDRKHRALGQGDELDEEEKIDAFRREQEGKYWTVLFKLLPSVGETRERMRRAGLNITFPMYLLILLMTSIIGSLYFEPFTFDLRNLGLGDYSEYNAAIEPIFFLMIQHLLFSMVIIKIFETKRRKRMVEDLERLMDFMARGIDIGQTPETALRESINDLEGPLFTDLKIVPSLLDVGWSFTEALHIAAEDISLEEFDFFTVAIAAQQESGGNLGKILGNLSETIRQRRALHQKISSISMEGKVSVAVLALLPLGVLAMMYSRDTSRKAELSGAKWGQTGSDGRLVEPIGMTEILFFDDRGQLGGVVVLIVWLLSIYIAWNVSRVRI